LSTDSVFSLYLFLLSVPLLPCSTLFPYTTLFRSGFTWPGAWRAPHLAVPLVATLALPIVGLSARGFMPTIALVLALQIVFMLVEDRKSTRLNSSHVSISYAVFCLKKKTLAEAHSQ